ncbi:M28 family peptidase [Spongiivirga sp. MCCC 1A20706]|uniref:M28 family peptidase n=1 Tax=Spongiivirga sp. MCCC 1A20706 TaxID=3160963 RepID=UPI0039773CBB
MRAFIVTFGFLAVLSSCKKEVVVPENTMKADVILLASDSLGGRQTGSKFELKAASFIAKRFEDLGLTPKGNANTYLQTFSFKPKTDPHQEITYTESGGDSITTGTNVIGFLDNKADKTIVIGAHYDHLGLGGEGSLHREGSAIHNGADDNASGTAIMMHLAKRLQGKHTQNNYLFMAFSGEEMGLLGSNFFVKNSTIPIESINYMINMDMVGRLKNENTLAVYGVGTSPVFNQTVNATNTNFKLIIEESGVGPSDHTSFYLSDIPVLHFFTGQHEDYHKPGDDAEKLNYEGMKMIADYIEAIIKDLDDNGKLAFRKTKNESQDVPRFKVALGVVPDYLFDGKGMRIDGVSEDKPAQKAGLQKGDVVIQLGDSTVVDMMSYMRALSIFEEGDATKVVVNRNGEQIEAEIKF